MPPRRLLQTASVLSALLILVLDTVTPLGFAHGDLYLISILLAALSGSKRFLACVAIASVSFTLIGIGISPPGMELRYWATNRLLSCMEIVVITALCAYIMQRYFNLRADASSLRADAAQLQADNQELRELTPSADNPLAPFKHRHQFQLFSDAIPQIIWTAESDGSIDYVNLALSRYTGKPRVMLAAGGQWASIIFPADLQKLSQQWSAAVERRTTYELECRLLRHDGSWRWHLVQGAPVRDEDGTVIKWCGSAIDIHDIRVYIERFEHVARATVDAISDWDVENNRIWWNQGVTNLFGYSREEMMQSPQGWTERVHPEDRENALAAIYDTLESDRERMYSRYRFLRKDGSVAIVEEHGFVIRDKEGKAVRLVSGMTDITQKTQLAEQLSHAQRLQTVGELTGGVAHDFNNLLTVIQGNTELMTEQLPADSSLQPLVEMIGEASRRAAELVQRLLAFARKQPLNPRPTDIPTLVQNMEALVRRALPERISIKISADAQLPPALIDPPQLESALLNLCLNARDAIPGHGDLLLEISAVELDQAYCEHNPEAAPGQYVLLTVSDTGGGMTREVRERAFDPFFTTKKHGTGSGLGLSMVYGFIKQSGGHISVYSEPEAGTTIRMYLPVSPDRIVHYPLTPESNALSPTSAPHCVTGTVLLVEDEEMVRQYAEKQFRELGYDVVSASSGAQALALLRELGTVGLLFTDVIMEGGMNGPELAEAARSLQPDIKVLFTSGYTENAITHQGRLNAGTHLLAKPWRRDDLLRKLRTIDDLRPESDQ